MIKWMNRVQTGYGRFTALQLIEALSRTTKYRNLSSIQRICHLSTSQISKRP